MAGLQETAQFIRLVDNISRAIDGLPNKIAAEAVNFSKQRFRESAWIDNSTEPWKKRKNEKGWGKRARPGRKILVDRAILMRSIRKIAANSTYIEIGTNVPYAKIHNYGGVMDINQHVKSYTRKRASTVTSSGRRRRPAGGDVTVKAHNRHMKFRMPRRQFIGPSAYLNRRLERLCASEIVSAANKSR